MTGIIITSLVCSFVGVIFYVLGKYNNWTEKTIHMWIIELAISLLVLLSTSFFACGIDYNNFQLNRQEKLRQKSEMIEKLELPKEVIELLEYK